MKSTGHIAALMKLLPGFARNFPYKALKSAPPAVLARFPYAFSFKSLEIGASGGFRLHFPLGRNKSNSGLSAARGFKDEAGGIDTIRYVSLTRHRDAGDLGSPRPTGVEGARGRARRGVEDTKHIAGRGLPLTQPETSGTFP